MNISPNLVYAKNSVLVLIVKILGAGIGLLTAVSLGRQFGVGFAGQYLLFLSILNLCGLFLAVGGRDTYLRAQAGSQGSASSLTLNFSFQNTLVVLFTVVSFLGAALIRWIHPDSKIDTSLFLIFSLSAIFRTVTILLAGRLVGAGKSAEGVAIEELLPKLVPLAFIFLNFALTFRILFFSILIGYVIACIVGVFYTLRIPGSMLVFSRKSEEVRKHFHLVKSQYYSSILVYGKQYGDLIILSLLLTPSELGIYGIVHRISVIFVMLSASINVSISSTVTRLYTRGMKEKLIKVLKIALASSTSLTMIGIFTLVFFYKDILLYSGIDPNVYGFVFFLLIAANALNAVFSLVGRFHVLVGQSAVFVRLIVCAFVLQVLLIFSLVSYIGIIGAALASLIATVFFQIAVSRSTFRIIKGMSVKFTKSELVN